ncbi:MULTISPECIES: site-specific integrase [unclassified Lactococcus]|nr:MULTISPECIES: site-specific integrase [unclassified Lactococcus]KAF6652805.1 site-specific integrase [Lactococcus sp. EKM101L]KAF6610199.1 site-specific integrase [Lactococcus sp. EKM201L]KAF6612920.1 site-specific integrase [Lactococcus sp. EKM203L]KAF6642974.1 site-specific integrase [Lactococcus sp. EKM501L]KAF6646959.1 site-specific integrase [Lactococcus sp. EKM502L]
MWVEDLPNGKYKYCERYTDTKGKLRKVSVTLDKNSSRAQNEASRLLFNKIDAKLEKEKQKIEDEKNKITSITFWEVQDEFLTVYNNTVKARTVTARISAKNKIREMIPEKTLLTELTSNYILSLLEKLYYADNYSYPYMILIKSNISMVLDYAISKEYIENNPSSKVKIKKKIETFEQRQAKKDKYLELDELRDILNQLRIIDKPTALIIEFMALTGLRYGECAALQYKNVNTNTIDITGSFDPTTHSKTTPKNVHSERTIALSERARKILDERINLNSEMNINNGNPEDFIFVNRHNFPEYIETVNSRLKKVKSDKKLTTHIFRHTHIAMLTEIGIPLKAIMERVGHTNPNTTLSIYSHVTDKMSKNIVEKLNKISL